jgi:FkbM family methyltransferase
MRSQSDSEVETLGLTGLKWYARSFPVSKGKERVVSLLWRPLSRGRHKFTVNLHRSNIRVTCDLKEFIQRHLYFWGGYEIEYCRVWKKLVKRSRVIFDVGANVGVYSLLAARTNPAASIHAFEPAPAVLQTLRQNILLNGISNIRLNPLGVSSTSGTGLLRDNRGSDGSNGGMNFLVNRDVEPEKNEDLRIPIVSLDDYCEEEEIQHIDLLKMDIEGGEFEALVGAEKLLKSQSIGCILIEFVEWAAKRSNHSTAELKHLLVEKGYRIYLLRRRRLQRVQPETIPDGENVIALATDFNLSDWEASP